MDQGLEKNVSDNSEDDSEDEDYVPAQDKSCAGDSDGGCDADKSGQGKKRKAARRMTRVSKASKVDAESSDEEECRPTAKVDVKQSDWDDFLTKYNKPKSGRAGSDSAVGGKAAQNEATSRNKGSVKLSGSADGASGTMVIKPCESRVRETETIKKPIQTSDVADGRSATTDKATPSGLKIISVPSASGGLQQFLNQRLGGSNPLQIKPGEHSATAGGISSVLEKISQRGKQLSVLDKSKHDWDDFKSKTGITEEVKSINKGKACYTERVAFLERVDWKTFEKEREVRDQERKRRFNADGK